jgi:uncharacterized protein YdiU (UPF0061 family)
MTISGETIDFGPCAFLDEYDPKKTFSSIDEGGRYAFANQPRIALWNLARLAEALLPLIAENVDDAVRLASAELDRFEGLFEQAYLEVMRAKLGLLREEESDGALAEGLLSELGARALDYTVFFSRLSTAVEPSGEPDVLALFDGNQAAIRGWLEAWRKRLASEADEAPRRAALMRKANPTLIPRNHRVEEAIQAAVGRGDMEPFETLVRALATPEEARPEHAHLAEPPRPEQRVQQTFCGT